jgi:hypothetical protein
MTNQTIWKPISNEQERFLSSPADEALFGGAAGGGKTDCLCMEALRQVANPRYNGILFRRTFPEITMADGIESRTLNWYPAYGGRYNASRHVWSFPSGAKVFLGHLQHEKDVADYQSAQFGYIGFDELTHFSLYQYIYMFSRNRADIGSGVRCYVRGGTNPGGAGHKWVKSRFVNAGIINKIGFFAKINGVDTPVSRNHPYAKSRTFIPALLSSNPMLGADYRSNLRMLDPITQKQLEQGDWDAENRDDLIYPDFSDEFNVDIDADYDPQYPVFWGMDDGYTNPRCILLIQVRPFKGKPDRVIVFREYYRSHQLSAQSIDEVVEWGFPPPELLYYDPAAAEFGATAVSMGLNTWGGYNNIAEGIKVVRRFILDGNGERRLIISPRCENLIDSLQSYKKNTDSKQEQGGDPIPLKDGSEHASDGLRYFLATRFLHE